LTAIEPEDASGINRILLYFTQDRISWSFVDVTTNQEYTFYADDLNNGTYYWYFWLFDNADNHIKTSIKSFTVVISIIDLTPIIPLGVLSSFILGSAAIILYSKRKK